MNLRRALRGPDRGLPSERAIQVNGEAKSLADTLLQGSRAELVRADAKASTLFSVSGVAFGVILGTVFAGDWSPVQLHDICQALWWIGAASAIGSLVALGLAVFPRIRHPEEHERVRYFGDVARKENQQHLADSLRDTVKEEGYEHVIDQLWVVSQLAVTKYELIRWALYLLAVAGVLVLAAFVGDHRYH
jgi:hypothetical protein